MMQYSNELPPRKLTYPTNRETEIIFKIPLGGDMLVPTKWAPTSYKYGPVRL